MFNALLKITLIVGGILTIAVAADNIPNTMTYLSILMGIYLSVNMFRYSKDM